MHEVSSESGTESMSSGESSSEESNNGNIKVEPINRKFFKT